MSNSLYEKGAYIGLRILLALVLCGIVAGLTFYYTQLAVKKSTELTHKVDLSIGIDTLESVTIGGVEQWVHIRGRDNDNPILLFLHGGPGFSHIGWFDDIQRPWEDYFTVVQWDQRQTGKSYASLESLGATVSNQQMIDDTEEMIAYLRQRFQREKIFLIGKSYGSYLGMHMVKRKPEWLYAYIGDGQMVNTLGYIEAEYQHIINYAQRSKNDELISRLEAMSPRIDPANQWVSFVKYEYIIWEELNKIGKGMSRTLTTEQLFGNFSFKQTFSPHMSLQDHINFRFGDPYVLTSDKFNFSKEFMEIDLPSEIGSEFEVPVFLFTGGHDWHVPRDFQTEWFDSITAPYKEQVVFDNSSHFPYLEEPGRYVVALATKVLPFANKGKNIFDKATVVQESSGAK